MRKFLIGMVLGASASAIAALSYHLLSPSKAKAARVAVVLYDRNSESLSPVEIPEYAPGVAGVGEQLRSCEGIELHFVHSSGLHRGPKIGIFLDELNDVQESCLRDVMKSDAAAWHFEITSLPVELGLNS